MLLFISHAIPTAFACYILHLVPVIFGIVHHFYFCTCTNAIFAACSNSSVCQGVSNLGPGWQQQVHGCYPQ